MITIFFIYGLTCNTWFKQLHLLLLLFLLLLLLVSLHDQSSSSDEVGGLLQVLQAPHIISGEAELLMVTVRFALVGVCYISEEHARWSGPPHHRDTLGKARFLGLSRRWYASFSCLGFSAVEMMVVFSW